MEAPIGWIAFLFSILCLASQAEFACQINAQQTIGALPRNPTELQTPIFLDETVRGLTLANYMNGGPHIIETLINYQMIEQTRHPDASVSTWILLGTILRLALRMGYHRDPSHFPCFTPFQAEMRRRMFFVLHAMDIMLSLQLGLPRLMKDGHWDTQPPHNLLDTDFSSETTLLPDSRPETDITLITHVLAKHKILVVVGVIADTIMSVARSRLDPSALATDKRLEQRLRDAYCSISDDVKLESLNTLQGCPPTEVLHRFSLTVLLQKGLIILYWRYVMSNISGSGTVRPSAGRTRNEIEEYLSSGYRSCVRAAFKILELQSYVDKETRLGGALFPARLQISSIVSHEFLMATIVVVTHMYRLVTPDQSAQVENMQYASVAHRQETEAALETSRVIWRRQCTGSKDAARITGILDTLFKMLRGPETAPGQAEPSPNAEHPTLFRDEDVNILEGFGLLYYLQDDRFAFGDIF